MIITDSTDITEDKLIELGYTLLNSTSLFKKTYRKEYNNEDQGYCFILVSFWLHAGIRLAVAGIDCEVTLSTSHGQSVNMSDIAYFESKLLAYKE